jgi:hypothetical protein
MAAPQLLVHDNKDTVGVVVVEGLKSRTDMLCVVTADNSSFNLTAKSDVPIGHKVALTMSEHIDVAVSGILRREMTIPEAGDALIEMVVRTANGRLTAAEALGHREFVMTKLYRSA